MFPTLAELTVRREEVRYTDVRRSAVADSYGRFGEDFSEAHLEDFVRRRLLEAFPPVDSDRVVINVRRGDHYSDHTVRGLFALDVDAYLRVAVPRVLTQRPVSAVHVVSDGLDWCRARLGWIETEMQLPLSFATGAQGAAADLATVATARRLIVTNSTFSYWAGYVHDVLYPGTHADVWAPRFFSRGQDDWSAWQLNPRWSVVEDIPGGWNS
ncbi:alpha-1,2-fucosyltransferase [Fodinibacter luteus]